MDVKELIATPDDREHERAERRLSAALAEQQRSNDRYDAAVGGPAHLVAAVRVHAADQEVAARDAWLRWVDDDGYRGLNAGPFELRAGNSGPVTQPTDRRAPSKPIMMQALSALPEPINGLTAVSQENTKIVRQAFENVQEGVRSGDHGAAFDKSVREGISAPDLEWRAGGRGGVSVPGMEDAVGRDGFVQFMRRWTEDFDDLDVQLEEIIDVDDDRVVAITGWHGVGNGSRAPFELRTGMLCTLEAGRVVRSILFLDPNHALKAAGLPSSASHAKHKPHSQGGENPGSRA